MTCTSIPILWYSVFDYEYEKETPKLDDEEEKNTAEGSESETVLEKSDPAEKYWDHFMMNPNLYKLGIGDECFS